jgi:hypothetical protein
MCCYLALGYLRRLKDGNSRVQHKEDANRGNGMFHCDGRGAACPFCHVQNAFDEELHANHSLCAVISLLDV